MRIFLLRRRHLVALLGVVLVLAIFAAVNAPAAVIASASTRQLPIYCVDRSDNLVSISFDAAWGDVRLRCPSSKALGTATVVSKISLLYCFSIAALTISGVTQRADSSRTYARLRNYSY